MTENGAPVNSSACHTDTWQFDAIRILPLTDAAIIAERITAVAPLTDIIEDLAFQMDAASFSSSLYMPVGL